jgi:hypothetical protein
MQFEISSQRLNEKPCKRKIESVECMSYTKLLQCKKKYDTYMQSTIEDVVKRFQTDPKTAQGFIEKQICKDTRIQKKVSFES